MREKKSNDVKKPITIRLSEKERAIINRNAEATGYGNNISGYIRQCCLKPAITIVKHDREIMDCNINMIQSLSKIEQLNPNINFDPIRKEIHEICLLLNV